MGSLDVGARLALFVCCLAVAVTAGWAFGRIAGLVNPELAGPATGFEHVRDAHAVTDDPTTALR